LARRGLDSGLRVGLRRVAGGVAALRQAKEHERADDHSGRDAASSQWAVGGDVLPHTIHLD
jgi:hypothetical protein